MPTYKLSGIDVDFPFEAYDCQLVYMEKVIQSLQNKCNALLESPTGTGKTLCLLCATLAWRKSLGGFSTGSNQRSTGDASSFSMSQSRKLPLIIYTSRTHSQLRQVVQELKRSSYRPKMVVLGSREQLCIHDEVRLLHGKAQTNACRMLSRNNGKRRCTHYLRVGDFLKSNPTLGDEPIDIEELVNIGKSCGACPYYVSRELHKSVDILFAPYNYLVDRSYRKSLSIEWDDSILIFDEAHNLEGICADAASFDLPSGLLSACISEATSCIDLSVARRDKSDDKSKNPDDFAILRALLMKLEKRIAEIPIKSKELGFTEAGHYIYELLADLNITHKTAPKLIGTVEEAALLLQEEKQQKANKTSSKLEIMSDILRIIFRGDGNTHAKYYRVHVQEVETKAADFVKGKASRTLSWWCFNPGIAMDEFSKKGVGSIILTSGTLSPLDSFAQELRLEFPIRLENPHVISSEQIWAGVVPCGPSGWSLNSSYSKRDTLEYKQELGNAVVNFARIVPDGLLVFFPSYYLMDQCIGCWKNMTNANSLDSKTIWERICMHKQPVIEPRQSSMFATSIEDFMAKLKDTKTTGAVFFAVCRGKVSEGLDFADCAGRAVVVTGMPFATRTDPKVRLKREFLDQEAVSQKEKYRALTGEDWYSQQASRAVNQAVGRVIRHQHDYGAIIFCDERFAHPSRQSQISLWIQPHIKCYSKFGEIVFTLTRFFRDKRTYDSTKLRTVKVEDLGAVSSSQSKEKRSDSGNANKLCAPLLDMSDMGRFVTPISTSMDQDRTTKPLYSLHRVKEENLLDPIGKVPPANRSTITPLKKTFASSLEFSSDQYGNEKKLLILGKKSTLQHHNEEVIDLTKDSSIGRITSKEAMITNIAKKPRILKLEKGDAQACSARVLETNQAGQSNSMEFSSQGIRDIETSGKEVQTTGSAFLTQVKEKLTASEYKEFVGFMKAMKSKAMKIGDLQSIVSLFRGPERLQLLTRFKDYLPAKYHTLYDQHIGKIDES